MSKLSAEQKQKMRALLSDGLSLRQIGRLIGVSAQSVCNYAKSLKANAENTDSDGCYSEAELWELWHYCKNQSDAPQIISDLACVPLDEAKRMIQRWEGRDA